MVLEDHQIVIDGYLFRFSQLPQIEVVGTVTYGDDLEPQLAACPADIVFMDVSVPSAPDNANPYPILHVIPRLRQRFPELSILVISMLTERGLIRGVMDAGANGYILKDDREAIKQLPEIVLAVTAGENYLSRQLRPLFEVDPETGDSEAIITPRQQEILSVCSAYPDLSLQQIAQRIGVQYSTVRNTMSQAYFRLGVHSLPSAITKARKLGLVTP